MEQNLINKDDYLNILNEDQGFWEFVRERLDYYELEENTDDILSLADDIRYIFKEVFESLPVEQIHYGEWLPVDDKNDAFDCSECDVMVVKKHNYCPNCGAKMKCAALPLFFS